MTEATNTEPRPVQPFRYWDYPPPGPVALAMLAPSPLRDQLQALLKDGDADEIKEWLATAEVAAEVKEVLRQGLRGEEVYDAVTAASLRWNDIPGSCNTCVVRRQDGGLVYEASQDAGEIIERQSPRELTGLEIVKMMLTAVYGDPTDDPDTFSVEEFLESWPDGLPPFEASSDFHEDLPDWRYFLTETLCPEKHVEGMDLTGGDFAGADLTGLWACGTNLESASFYRARLVGADFFMAQLSYVDLSEAELRYAFLRRADLEGAQLRKADLRNADLSFACLRNAKLCGADLRHADLRHADTRGADFAGAILDDCRR